jgi:NitT/TauT family transport system substrate-binding protein
VRASPFGPWLAGAMVGVVCLLAGGCGGSSAPAGSAPSSSGGGKPAASTPASVAAASGAGSSSATGAAGKMTQVTFAKAVDTFGLDVVNIAQMQGFFKKEGIDPKIEVVGNSTIADSALMGGQAQFTLVGSLPLLLGRSHNLPLISVNELDYGVPLQMIVSNKWIAQHHLSTSQSVQTRLKGLQGSVLGQIGPTDLDFFRYMMSISGVSSSSVRVVKMGSDPAAAAAIEKGVIDEFAVSPPQSLQVAAQGYGKILLNYKTIPQFRDMTYDLIVTSQPYAQAHPDVVGRVATAVGMADNFIRQHPKQSLADLEKLWPHLSPSVVQQSFHILTFASDGLQSAQRWQNAVNAFQTFGVIKGTVAAPEGTVWTNQYVNKAALGSAG